MTILENDKRIPFQSTEQTPSPKEESLKTSLSRSELIQSTTSDRHDEMLAEKKLELMSELAHELKTHNLTPRDLASQLRNRGGGSMNMLTDSHTLREAQVSLSETGEIIVISSMTMQAFSIELAELQRVYDVVDMHPDYAVATTENSLTATLSSSGRINSLIPEKQYTMTLSSATHTKSNDLVDFGITNAPQTLKPENAPGSVLDKDLRRSSNPLEDHELVDEEVDPTKERITPPSLFTRYDRDGANLYESTVMFEDEDGEDNKKRKKLLASRHLIAK
jgi:hypothetical protein